MFCRRTQRPSGLPLTQLQQSLKPGIPHEWLPDRVEPQERGGVVQRVAQSQGQAVDRGFGLAVHHVYLRNESLIARVQVAPRPQYSVNVANALDRLLLLATCSVGGGEPEVDRAGPLRLLP